MSTSTGWFTSLDDAITTIEKYRMHYNTQRPHSWLGYQTRSEKLADYRRSMSSK